MTNYYVTKDGVLLRYGTCPKEWFDQQVAEGEEIHEGDPPAELLQLAPSPPR